MSKEFEVTIHDNMDVSVKVKNINIRNVDAKLYKQFSQLVKSRDISIGEAFNSMMREALREEIPVSKSSMGVDPISMKLPLKIAELNHFEITKQDLIEGDAPCIFENIEKLYFDDDVNAELFNRYVKFIIGCQEVSIPKSIPKLQIYSKIRNCESIILK